MVESLSINNNSSKNEYSLKNELIEFAVFSVFLISISQFGMLLFGFFKGGFTDVEFSQFWSFYAPFIAFYILIFSLKLIEIFTKGEYAKAIIHDPTKAPAIFGKFNFVRNPIKFFFFSLTITGWLSFIAIKRQIIFFPVKLVSQQATTGAKLFGYIEPAVTSETIMFLGIISLLFTVGLVISKKLKIDKKITLPILAVIIILIGGFWWMGLHGLRYSAAEGSLISTFFFGLLTATTIILFGSVIFAWVWHFNNNLAIGIKALFSSEIWTIYYIVGLIILTILTLLIIFHKPKKEFIVH